jgi:glycosyltransferase involved in cell wall biosynthesis
MPHITVIIPTYNRSQFVVEAVESVLSQTYPDFEVIVVDDGSTDDTVAVLRRFEGRIRLVRQENRGPAAARNRGLSEASGEFIAFLDSDDLWDKRKLERQVSFLEDHPSELICYTDEIWIRRGVRVNPRKRHAKWDGWIFEKCLPLCIISPSSVMMRRPFFELVGTFDEDFPVCEDYELWLRASARLPIRYLPEKLIIKRGGHDDQLSRRWGQDVYRVRAILKLLQTTELSAAQEAAARQELARKCRILEQGYAKRNRLAEANYYRELAQREGYGS